MHSDYGLSVTGTLSVTDGTLISNETLLIEHAIRTALRAHYNATDEEIGIVLDAIREIEIERKRAQGERSRHPTRARAVEYD
jgi:hypothetical protein